MRKTINKLLRFAPLVLILCTSGLNCAVLYPLPSGVGYDNLEDHQEIFHTEEWDSLLIREFEPQSSAEPTFPTEFSDPEASIEETPDVSGEDEYPLPPISDRSQTPSTDGGNTMFNFSYVNDVMEEPADDSEFVVIQWSNVTKAASGLSFNYRSPICVIHRKQMKCFIRKRCGFYVKNGKRATGTRGPFFEFSTKRHCIFNCGWKAGRQCWNF